MSEIVKKEKDRVRRMIRVIQEYSGTVGDVIAEIKALKPHYESTVDHVEQEHIFHASFWISAVFKACGDYLQAKTSDSYRWEKEIVHNFLCFYRSKFLDEMCYGEEGGDLYEWKETDENICYLTHFNRYLYKHCLPEWFLEGADLFNHEKRMTVYMDMSSTTSRWRQLI